MNTYANGTCAMKFPSSYTLMDVEEMTYVDGGGIGQTVAYYAVKHGIDMAVNAAFGGGTLGLVRQVIKAGKEKFKRTLVDALLSWTSARIANLIVGRGLSMILDVATGSVGGVVANWLGRSDGKADKQSYFSKVKLF